MRTVGNAVGFLLLGVGIIWLLQEYFLLPGSFLANEVPWSHRGAIAGVAGLLLLFAVNLGRR